MSRYVLRKGRNGEIISSSQGYRIGNRPPEATPLLRGVVIATYMTDANVSSFNGGTNEDFQQGVLCDVLVYNGPPGAPDGVLFKCLVSQDRGGLHDGDIWRPKAATRSVTTGETFDRAKLALAAPGDSPDDEGKPAIPEELDGDHVLVGFCNNDHFGPIILRSLPHPSADKGKTSELIGNRLRTVEADQSPRFVKHHGVFYGVESSGDVIFDLTKAYDGILGDDSTEPQTATAGTFRIKLPSTEKMIIEIDGGPTFELSGKGADALLKIGDATKRAAIAEYLETLYGSLKTYLDTHVHLGGTGPTSAPTSTSPSWDPNIASNSLKVPDEP